jgi:tetratricopeptide (TPR) repeat protein
MATKPTYPDYISRTEEQQIRQVLEEVRGDRETRAVLLYGPGGIGKTSLVRNMVRPSTGDTVWVDPIDVDDPEIWLLSNLEQRVARKIDPGGGYFREYRKQLLQLPSYTDSSISQETIASHLGRIKKIFAECYRNYVRDGRRTVVMTFDTVETIRGTNLLVTLTQWMKELCEGTLFILSGRNGGTGARADNDPITAELTSQYQKIPVRRIDVGGFSLENARRFILASQVSDGLVGEELDKLAYLCRGHPLWLVFMLDYLATEGMPEEAGRPTEYIQQNLPYDGAMTPGGAHLHEAFLRRLVAPYRETDFWHEGVKRLAIVRQPVAEVVWQRLMSDRTLPDDVDSLGEAWPRLLKMPWLRPRGNGHYVTLHDAVAEEFSKRIFPLHDHDQQWRHRVWGRARDIYSDLAQEKEAALTTATGNLNRQLRRYSAVQQADTPVAVTLIDDDLVTVSSTLDLRRRELDLYKAASVYYEFLCDFEAGCLRLISYFQQAKNAESERDAYFQDLIVVYLQRFLPSGAPSDAFNDVIKAKLDEFRRWLTREHPDYLIDLSILVAQHLIDTAQAQAALNVLSELPRTGGHVQQHRLNIVRGNACMRIHGKAEEGERYFEAALESAIRIKTPDRDRLVAEAHKDKGFYYRNTGQWDKADASYYDAHRVITATRNQENRAEVASVQTNWAYVKGLKGSYDDALALVGSAIAIRSRLKLSSDEGMSWSVCGEVYRYGRRFHQAWSAYAYAEQLLHGGRAGLLGIIFQEQAICLYQAAREGIQLVPDPGGTAKELITKALDICVAHEIRSYPSALNRAGRIFGADDPAAGLEYLRTGVEEASRLSDGWFWFANLIEYAELSYRVWRDSGDIGYIHNITARADQVVEAFAEYVFAADLKGRWDLLQGHLAVREYDESGEPEHLDNALQNYKNGFASIVQRNAGSSGPAAIQELFDTFGSVFTGLPPSVRESWEGELRSAWSTLAGGSTLLLPRLEALD